MSNLEFKLPIGVTEFHEWSDDIIKESGLPLNDSMKWALAVAITHLPSTDANKPKQYFIDILRKGAANQVAFAMISQFKEESDKRIKEASEAAAKLQAEATATTVADAQG